nr:MAG TPA: hypothetical protein [Caudoviricetes sp.]
MWVYSLLFLLILLCLSLNNSVPHIPYVNFIFA